MNKLVKEVSINKPIDEVYKLWTTKEGIDSFFGVDSKVEITVGGPFEIYFLMDLEPGLRGSENCRVLAYQENKFFSFDWNVPPHFEEERSNEYRSIVKVYFNKVDENSTHVELVNEYPEPSKNIEEILQYFDRAWGMVMKSMKDVLDGE